MPIVVGVNFKKVGRVYYFDPGELDLKENDLIIAETARGIEIGEVSQANHEIEESELVAPLKRILRLATPRDIDQERTIAEKEKEAFQICAAKIEQHGLEMKLIDVDYCFDGTQGTFFFSAEGRVDFRELVKDLAQTLRIRVQLHQVGVRDEAKMFGGLGPCGRPLCCSTFLTNFEPVSMRMAKEQSLFLNPAKFSGLCGKLMCCLRYEYEVYRDAKVKLPFVGEKLETPKGIGRLISVNVIKNTVEVQFKEGEQPVTFSISEIPDQGIPEIREEEDNPLPSITPCTCCEKCPGHSMESEPKEEPEPESEENYCESEETLPSEEISTDEEEILSVSEDTPPVEEPKEEAQAEKKPPSHPTKKGNGHSRRRGRRGGAHNNNNKKHGKNHSQGGS